MVVVTYMDLRLAQTAQATHRSDETLHGDFPITFFGRGLHEEPLSDGQSMQPLGLCHPMG